MVRIHQGALAERVDTGPGARPSHVESCIYTTPAPAGMGALAPSQAPQPDSVHPQPGQRAEDSGRRVQQAIRRWGNSLAVRIPAECLRQAGLREGDPIEIVVGDDGRLSLEPLQRLDRRALASDLRQLQASMPITPSVIETCRDQERW